MPQVVMNPMFSDTAQWTPFSGYDAGYVGGMPTSTGASGGLPDLPPLPPLGPVPEPAQTTFNTGGSGGGGLDGGSALGLGLSGAGLGYQLLDGATFAEKMGTVKSALGFGEGGSTAAATAAPYTAYESFLSGGAPGFMGAASPLASLGGVTGLGAIPGHIGSIGAQTAAIPTAAFIEGAIPAPLTAAELAAGMEATAGLGAGAAPGWAAIAGPAAVLAFAAAAKSRFDAHKDPTADARSANVLENFFQRALKSPEAEEREMKKLEQIVTSNPTQLALIERAARGGDVPASRGHKSGGTEVVGWQGRVPEMVNENIERLTKAARLGERAAAGDWYARQEIADSGVKVPAGFREGLTDMYGNPVGWG